MNLSEECFKEHISGQAFQEGQTLNWWGLCSTDEIKWPNVVIWLSAPPRCYNGNNGPEQFYLLFDLTDYPAKAPTASLWDFENRCKLNPALWPKGKGDLQQVFRSVWPEVNALYAPWDRITIEKHGNNGSWEGQYGYRAWRASYAITDYLKFTRELLTSDDYYGV